jgi:hypothetical protein
MSVKTLKHPVNIIIANNVCWAECRGDGETVTQKSCTQLLWGSKTNSWTVALYLLNQFTKPAFLKDIYAKDTFCKHMLYTLTSFTEQYVVKYIKYHHGKS